VIPLADQFHWYLEKLEIWTPFNLIRKGNWSSVLLFALAYLVQGLLLEFWNYFSAIA
jgi:hypothetical protein